MAIVIKGGTLIDGTGQDPLTKSVIVIEGDSIVAVGRESEVAVPPGARSIDAEGRTVLPGFIDCHAHLVAYEYNFEKRLTTPASLTVTKTLKNIQAALEAGVTTVREAGGVDAGFKMAVEQGLIPGPRLLVSIVILAQTGALWGLHLGSGAKLDTTDMIGKVCLYCGGVEELRQYTRELLLAGADVINIYTTGSVFSGGPGIPAPQFTPAEIEAVVYEARAAGKRIMAHVDGGVGVRNAILAGVDSVDHPFYLSDEDVALLAEKGTFLVPTLACSYGIWNIAKQNPGAGIHAQAAARAEKIITDHVDGFGRAAAAGVKIAMGSDSFGLFQGDNLFELELMVQAGLTPMEAIVAGTKSGAELLGLEQTLGTVTPGKVADLLVVTGNPLDDITLLRDRRNLDLIMKNGEIFKNQLEG